MKVKVKSLSRVRPLATPWTAAYQAPPSMGIQIYSSLPLNENESSHMIFLYLFQVIHFVELQLEKSAL